MNRIPVHVVSDDHISQAGVASQLRGRPEALVLDEDHSEQAAVVVLVTDRINKESVRSVRNFQRKGCQRVVLVTTDLDDACLMNAVEAGVAGVLRRREATPENLAAAITSAACGNGSLAPDLVGRLLHQVRRLQQEVLTPRGIGNDGLNDRERSVLVLLAEGLDTSEIAQRLAYSERTIKNIIHDVITRLNLRNRSHAVAYAIKSGIV